MYEVRCRKRGWWIFKWWTWEAVYNGRVMLRDSSEMFVHNWVDAANHSIRQTEAAYRAHQSGSNPHQWNYQNGAQGESSRLNDAHLLLHQVQQDHRSAAVEYLQHRIYYTIHDGHVMTIGGGAGGGGTVTGRLEPEEQKAVPW